MTIFDRIKAAWNIFKDPEKLHTKTDTDTIYTQSFISSNTYLNSNYSSVLREKSVFTAMLVRIAIDISEITFKHVIVDENGYYKADVKDSYLNDLLLRSSNLDQTPSMLKRDIVLTMFNDGCAVLVPEDAEFDDNSNKFTKINSWRVGTVKNWHPTYIDMKLYNKDNGMFCDVSIDKCNAAIIENPLYSVINEPNSLVQRIIRNFAAMDDMISKTSGGKLDLIIQLPYPIRGDKADLRAEKRKKSIEDQLHNSTYGIAYIDPSEKVTQLNRPVTNNILDITKYYIEELQGQLGLDSSIMNGTANETTLNNYRQRTIKPIATAISEELTKKYISEEAYKNGERILFFDNPFKLISVSDLTNFLDKLINCEVMTPNEARQIFLMLRPKDDARANQLANRNINPTDKIDQTNNTGSSGLEDDRKEKNIKNE